MLRLLFIFWLSFAAFLALGCHKKQGVPSADTTAQLAKLPYDYLKGDAGQARATLQEYIRVIEDSKLSSLGEANASYDAYSRLFVLQKRLGNPSLAEAAFVKARYWYLRSQECGGHSEVDAAREVVALTQSKCEERVDRLDKAATGGSGAAYLKSLPSDTQPGIGISK